MEIAEKFVAKASEFKEGDRRIVFDGDNEIGVFRNNGQFYAYSNFCLHQGGSACEGLSRCLPGTVEHFHQRPIEHVDPDDRYVRIVAVIVPSTVRRDDEVPAEGFAALAFHIGVAAVLGKDGAAGICAVDVGRRHVSGRIDRNRASHSVGHLERRPPSPRFVNRMLWRSANSIGETSARPAMSLIRSRKGR
jgi:hypothetical protein